MNWPDFYLLCFAVGSLWTLAAVLMGGLHFGHGGHGHAGHSHTVQGHGAPHGAAGTHAPSGQAQARPDWSHGAPGTLAHAAGSWFGSLLSPSCAAIFLAWFGGVGYLLTRHSGLGFWINLSLAAALGLGGAWVLAAFLRFLQAHEKPLDAAEYEMAGVLGRVTSPVRPDGVGEMIFVRDGARKPAAVRSEDGTAIARGEEVIVVRYERGVAYVRTWEAMTQRTPVAARPEAFQREKQDVE